MDFYFCTVDNLNKVFRLQKRTARVILNADTRANNVALSEKFTAYLFFMKLRFINVY